MSGAGRDVLRAAVVGCGAVGARHARAILDSPDARLVAACDVDRERATAVGRPSAAAAYASLDEALSGSKIDVVFVATPDHLHREPVCTALEAGCDVFCEKPLATSYAEAVEMAETATRHGHHLAVDYNRRFGFGYVRANELLRGGAVGIVRHTSLTVSDGHPAAARTAGPYTLLTMLLTHHIDLVRWLCGEPASVYCRCANPDGRGQYHDATLLLITNEGAVVTIAGLWRADQPRTQEVMRIEGAEGVLVVDDVLRSVTLRGNDPDDARTLTPSPFDNLGNAFYDTIPLHIAAFLRSIRRGEPPPVAAADGVRGLEIVEAAIRSHESGAAVAV